MCVRETEKKEVYIHTCIYTYVVYGKPVSELEVGWGEVGGSVPPTPMVYTYKNNIIIHIVNMCLTIHCIQPIRYVIDCIRPLHTFFV